MTLGLRGRSQNQQVPEMVLGGPSRSIPFDQTFRIKLAGEPNKVHKTSVTVSIESAFTAVSIGYGVVEEVTPITFGPPKNAGVKELGQITIGDLAAAAETAAANAPDVPNDVPPLEAVFRAGIRLNPTYSRLALLKGIGTPVDSSTRSRLFQLTGDVGRKVQFLYALFDDGSGREFQSEPVLNIAGLGSAEGKRPFRYFPRPIEFQPRASIRLEVTEISDFTGELHVCLHGYKVLGGTSSPTSLLRKRRRNR